MSRRRGGRHPKVRMRVESSVAYPGHDSAPGTTGHGGAAGPGCRCRVRPNLLLTGQLIRLLAWGFTVWRMGVLATSG
jgi:hypothetical protein